MKSLFHIANKINEMLTEYELGNLQELRKNIYSLSRSPSKYVFDQRGVKKIGELISEVEPSFNLTSALKIIRFDTE